MDSLVEQLPSLMGVMVGICAVLMPVAIVGIVLYYRHRRSVEVLATVRHLAEKGLPVPAGLLQADDRGSRRIDLRSELKAALSTLAAGIGLMIFFYVSGIMRFLWGVGALVAIVGAAQLIAMWLTRKLPHDDAGHDAG